jgi:hypothetical protein
MGKTRESGRISTVFGTFDVDNSVETVHNLKLKKRPAKPGNGDFGAVFA